MVYSIYAMRRRWKIVAITQIIGLPSSKIAISTSQFNVTILISCFTAHMFDAFFGKF